MKYIIKYFLILPLLLASFAANAGDVMLKRAVSLNHSIIRLSDVFEGLDTSEDAEIALSPAPGRSVTYDANVLRPLATRYNISWTPNSYADKIILTRAAIYITPDMVRDVVLKRINFEKKQDETINLKFDGRSPALTLAAGEELSYDVNSFEYDKEIRRFRGRLVAQNENGVKTQFISGHLIITKNIPVLSRHLSAGTVIAESDVRWKEVDKLRLNGDVLTNLDQIIGQELRRAQGEGARFMARDVSVPRMIKRGDIVTLKIITPYMQIATKGRALEDGVYGEVVRVTNTRSKRVIEGTVSESGVVRIDTIQQIATAE